MRVINPVLRNECKMAVRNRRFTTTLFVYIAIVSIGVMLYYKEFSTDVFAMGLSRSDSSILYIIMAIVQAVFLIFLVPSLTSSSISSEREKQTLDILLSTKLTSIQIVIGKLFSSLLRVGMLIICTLPLYGVASLLGGLNIGNLIELTIFFIINTIFVGSLGVLISTYCKTSKVATTLSYFATLFIYIGIIVLAFILLYFQTRYSNGNISQIELNPIIYLSPLSGFISLLSNQVNVNDFYYMTSGAGISSNAEYISMIIQLVLSGIFIFLASVKLNPLNKKKVKVKTNKKRG